MKNLFKNPFVFGLWMAVSVTLTNFLQAYISTKEFDLNGLWVALLIVIVGFVGKYLTGVKSTSLALLGSAIVSIVPLITDGHIDWKLVVATLLLKLIGLGSAGTAQSTTDTMAVTDPIDRPKDKPKLP